MNDRQFAERAAGILHNMALERKGFWRSLFRRWHISDEPLRNDAANLLREYGVTMLMPKGCQWVGDESSKEPKKNAGIAPLSWMRCSAAFRFGVIGWPRAL